MLSRDHAEQKQVFKHLRIWSNTGILLELEGKAVVFSLNLNSLAQPSE